MDATDGATGFNFHLLWFSLVLLFFLFFFFPFWKEYVCSVPVTLESVSADISEGLD